MQLPTEDLGYEDPGEDERELDTEEAVPWYLHRLVPQAVVVAFCALGAITWSGSLHSEAPAPLVAGVDVSVLAGEPTPSIVAAAKAATPGAVSSSDAAPTPGAVEARPGPFTLTDPDDPNAYTPPDSAAIGAVDPVGGPAVGAGDGATNRTGQTGAVPTPTPAAVPPPPDRPTRVFPVNQAKRLSTAQLVTMVEENKITNVADFLSALPPFMGESYTLMEESRSRHQASTEYPRLIMYGPDARILIGVSSHPSDPLREVVEIAELDEDTGLWRFSQFDFTNAFFHDTNAESCAGCHGFPQRPIWGEYPNWPGAFAGSDERLAGGQSTTLMRLKSDPLDRFHHVVFPSDHSIQNNGQFYLPTRQYGYANTSFNFELNAAVADGIARRIIGHPNWATEGYRMLTAQWDCSRNLNAAQIDAMYNRFGIDGNNDFQLESPVFEAKASQRDEYDWNQGSTGLDNSVAFRTLDLAAQQDPGLAAIVDADQLFVDFSNYWFNILGADRSAFLQANGIYETDFRPQNLGGGFVGRVCDYLASKGA